MFRHVPDLWPFWHVVRPQLTDVVVRHVRMSLEDPIQASITAAPYSNNILRVTKCSNCFLCDLLDFSSCTTGKNMPEESTPQLIIPLVWGRQVMNRACANLIVHKGTRGYLSYKSLSITSSEVSQLCRLTGRINAWRSPKIKYLMGTFKKKIIIFLVLAENFTEKWIPKLSWNLANLLPVRNVFKCQARMQLVTSDTIYLNFTFPSSGETGRTVQQKSRAHTHTHTECIWSGAAHLLLTDQKNIINMSLLFICLQQHQVSTCHFDCEGDPTP